MQNSENVLALGGRRHNSAHQRLTGMMEVCKERGGGKEQDCLEGSCLMRLSCECVQKHQEDFNNVLQRICSRRTAMGKHRIVP